MERMTTFYKERKAKLQVLSLKYDDGLNGVIGSLWKKSDRDLKWFTKIL